MGLLTMMVAGVPLVIWGSMLSKCQEQEPFVECLSADIITIMETGLSALPFLRMLFFLLVLFGSISFYLKRCLRFIDKDEQIIIECLTEQIVVSGPKTLLLPLAHKSSKVKKVLTLEAAEYCVVKNSLSGDKRVVVGPKMVFLQPYDKFLTGPGGREKQRAISLSANEYVRFQDNKSGKIRVERGESCVVPGADEVVLRKEFAMDLQVHEYVKIQDRHTGVVRVERGEGLVFLGPHEEFVEAKQAGLDLKVHEYVKIQDRNTGAVRVERGEGLVFLGPSEEFIGAKQAGMDLKVHEYVKIQDRNTGAVRVERGEGLVFLGPSEEFMGTKQAGMDLKVHEYVMIQDHHTGAVRVERGERLVILGPSEEFMGSKLAGVNVDEETSVLVRNKRTGQQHLVTEKKLFFPANDEEILGVRKLIKLADYEACIVRDKTGKDAFYFGSSEEHRSFFLPPHSSLVTLLWSRGRRRELRDLKIQILDLRPMYMSFEFNCRTNDNVELVLEGSFFWEITDLKAMTKFTNDTTGDICNHARSRFIELVSRVTLQEFMTKFNDIAEQVHKKDNTNFYTQRGVKIHSLEVTAYHCAEASTALILEEIIQETTNRMNRLQQQESENEVQLKQIRGDIEEERARGELIKIQTENSNAKSKMEGLAEAERVRSFLSGLAEGLPDMDASKAVSLWRTLRKEDALKAVANGNARLYFTPKDANLSIESHEHIRESGWVAGDESSEST